jgi:hypothetical protein
MSESTTNAVERQPAHVYNDGVRPAYARRLWDERADDD